MRFLESCRRCFIVSLAASSILPFFVPTEAISRYAGIAFYENLKVCEKRSYIGHYDKKDNSITLCTENYERAGISRSTVVRHEVIHRIQCNIGVKEVIPEKVLAYIVDNTFRDRDVLSVLLYYEGPDRRGEFEARVFQNLPEGIVSGLLFYSNIYRNIRKSIT